MPEPTPIEIVDDFSEITRLEVIDHRTAEPRSVLFWDTESQLTAYRQDESRTLKLIISQRPVGSPPAPTPSTGEALDLDALEAEAEARCLNSCYGKPLCSNRYHQAQRAFFTELRASRTRIQELEGAGTAWIADHGKTHRTDCPSCGRLSELFTKGSE